MSSFVVVHKAWLPAFEADLPYAAVQIEPDEGAPPTVELDGEALRVGLPVEVVLGAVRPDVTLPHVRPRRGGV